MIEDALAGAIVIVAMGLSFGLMVAIVAWAIKKWG